MVWARGEPRAGADGDLSCKGILDHLGVREQHHITTHHDLGYASQPVTDTQIGFSFHRD